MTKLHRVLLFITLAALLFSLAAACAPVALAGPPAQEPPPEEEPSEGELPPEEPPGEWEIFALLAEALGKLLDLVDDLIPAVNDLVELLREFLEEADESAEDPWTLLGRWAESHLLSIALEIFFKAPIALVWWAEKVVAAVVSFIVDENLWEMLWTPILDQLRSLVGGGPLGAIMFGAGGIMFVALGVAGLSMIVPSTTSGLAKPDRVLFWGAIVLTLFTSGGAGFDLMAQIETLRMTTARSIIGAADTGGIGRLVGAPMSASGGEVQDLSFALPAAFEEQFFPPPQYEPKALVVRLGLLQFKIPDFPYETDESIALRRKQGAMGLAVALLSLFGAWIMLLFGVTFASLSAGAIMLLVFFVAALPLGFFEFGSPIIMNIVKQYVYVFAVTLLSSVLLVTMLALTLGAFPGSVSGPQDMLGFIPVAIVVSLMMGKVSTMAIDQLGGSWSTVTVAVESASGLAYQRGTTTQDVQRFATGMGMAAMTMGVAAATGGVGAGLMAGLGSAVGSTPGGRRAGYAARLGAGRDDRLVQTFGTAAMSGSRGGFAGVLATQMRLNRSEKAAKEGAYGRAVQRTSARRDPHWKAVDAGAFLTTDLQSLSDAERAFFKQKDPRLARVRLEQAFGSPETAERVLSAYERGGSKAARQVRDVTETAQAVAMDLGSDGVPVFDGQGRQTEAYRSSVRAALEWQGWKDLGDPQTAQFVGEVAGAAVRRPAGIWSDEAAPHSLARATMEPGQAMVRPGNPAAAGQLRDLAVDMKWGEGELAALYRAVRDARAESARTGETVPRIVTRALTEMPAMRDAPRNTLIDAAYLATMAADGAQVQRGAPLDVRPAQQSFPMARAAWDAGAYGEAVDVYYRGEPASGDETGPWAGYAAPPTPPTPERAAQAREILVRALGSHRAADAAVSAWQQGVPEGDARQLALFMGRVGGVPAGFDGSGAPSAGFRDAVREATRRAEGQAVTAGGEEFFERMGDELLWEMNESMMANAGELASRITQEGGAMGPAAGQLQGLAGEHDWAEEELAMLIREAVRGTAPGVVAALPEFEGAGNRQVAEALAAGRDVVRAHGAAPADAAAAAMMMEGGAL